MIPCLRLFTSLRNVDPIRKAERVIAKKLPAAKQVHEVARQLREPIPANLLHEVNLRDAGRCQFKNCGASHWTEIHHIRPLSMGGDNALENLMTVCSAHHKFMHDYIPKGGKSRKHSRSKKLGVTSPTWGI